MWITRAYESTVRAAAERRPVVLLTGARQTGKTALLKHLFPQHAFVTLDLPSEAEEAERNPESFLARHGSPLVIDEVQYAPSLFRHLKIAADRKRSGKGQYLLTGSQKFALMREASESLAGRVDVLELETLALPEIRAARGPLRLPEVIVRGGYPELYAEKALDQSAFYRSYTATYLERDLRSLLRVGSLRDFERFLRACALRSAQLLNKANLARDVGISPSTANEWIGVLQASNIALLLEPWFLNASKSITKSPKLYIADTGLLCYLLGIRSADELLGSPLLGAVWETFVFAELRKMQEREEGAWSLFFWRDRGKEIDFLIHRGGRFELFEAKWTERPGGGDLASFARVEEAVGADRILAKTLVCRAPHAHPLGEGITAAPLEDVVRPARLS